ncbi:thialysine N-epsilon-acetyltransferase-like [Amphiura filiformis]|uniref:thialysine N-epsilon-acetyltransferase-like n=1 Tax=Amphiura filiformis TaxID=82378 RepID=UPI003B22892F
MSELQKYPDQYRTVTVEKLINDGFGPRPWYHCIVAECINRQDSQQEMEIIGLIMYSFSYDVYGGRSVFGLELFVKPEHRGHKLGKALMHAKFLHAKEQGCTIAQTLVFHKHLRARQFQASFGYVDQTTEVPDSNRLNFLELMDGSFQDTLKKAEDELKTYKHIEVAGLNFKLQ